MEFLGILNFYLIRHCFLNLLSVNSWMGQYCPLLVALLRSYQNLKEKKTNKTYQKIIFQAVVSISVNHLYPIKIVWTHFSVKKTSKRLIKQNAETKKEESEPHLICLCSELNFHYIVRAWWSSCGMRNIRERTLDRSNVETKWKLMISSYYWNWYKNLTLFCLLSRKIIFVRVSDSKGWNGFSTIGNTVIKELCNMFCIGVQKGWNFYILREFP